MDNTVQSPRPNENDDPTVGSPAHSHTEHGSSYDELETSSDNIKHHSCASPSDDVDDILVPKISMEFETETDAYNYYNRYARKVGFSVRRGWDKKTADGVVKIKVYFCSSQGKKDKEDKKYIIAKTHRNETRFGCEAYLKIVLHENGKYRVTKFHEKHNHELFSSEKVHMLRSHRKSTSSHPTIADVASSSRIKPKKTYAFMNRQAGGRENIGFLQEDFSNFLRTKRMKAMDNFDAGGLLEYFQKKKVDDPTFYYAIQIDQGTQITNIFWADSRMLADYERFGDVVCFDTTYQTNSYGRPFAPFIGVNHHKKTVVFGAALLYDETTESFKWLFNTFINAMSGKKPQTILTDQCVAMENGIASVMSGANHRICVWHMYQNTCRHLSHVFSGSQTFAIDFGKCVYDYEYEEDFLQGWDNMLLKYKLHDNSWLQQLFKEREKWAIVYGRNTFCADMKSTQRYESLNKDLKKYLNIRQNMMTFFDNFQMLLEDRRYAELRDNFKMTHSSPNICMPVMILTEAAKVYTPAVFEMFQKEFQKAFDLIVRVVHNDGTVTSYEVFYDDKPRKHTIVFNSHLLNINCSCQKYEFVRILCCHILRVFQDRGIKVIPEKYIMKRWTRNAAKVNLTPLTCEISSEDNDKRSVTIRYSNLLSNFVKISSMAADNVEVSKHVAKVSDKLFHDVENLLRNASSSVALDMNGFEGEPVNSPVDDIVEGNKNIENIVGPVQGKRIKNSLEKFSSKRKKRRNLLPFASSTNPSSACPPPIDFLQTLPSTLTSQGSSNSGINSMTTCPPHIYHPMQTIPMTIPTQGSYSGGINSFSFYNQFHHVSGHHMDPSINSPMDGRALPT